MARSQSRKGTAMLENMKYVTHEILKTRDEQVASGADPVELKRQFDQAVDDASAGVFDPAEVDCPIEMIGCWFDNVRGVYMGEAVINFAGQFKGFDPDENSRRAYDDDYTEEFIRAEDFLNEYITRPEGTTFGMSDNLDWGLWRDEDESEAG